MAPAVKRVTVLFVRIFETEMSGCFQFAVRNGREPKEGSMSCSSGGVLHGWIIGDS